RDLAVGFDQAERQMRGNRPAGVAGDHQTETARRRERKAGGRVHLEGWIDVHGTVSGSRDQRRLRLRGFSRGCRGVVSGGRVDDQTRSTDTARMGRRRVDVVAIWIMAARYTSSCMGA